MPASELYSRSSHDNISRFLKNQIYVFMYISLLLSEAPLLGSRFVQKSSTPKTGSWPCRMRNYCFWLASRLISCLDHQVSRDTGRLEGKRKFFAWLHRGAHTHTCISESIHGLRQRLIIVATVKGSCSHLPRSAVIQK